MSFISRYIAYLKRNPERYWFKRKVYGWGWVPATVEGWISLAAAIAIYVVLFVRFISHPNPDQAQITVFLIELFAWIIALVALCYVTGEPPKWQWGIPDEPDTTATS